MQSIPFTEVRARLAETLRDAEAGASPVVISRHGQPAGVLMSWSRYRELVLPGANGFVDSLNRWRADCLLPGNDADDPFAGLRDGDAGRPVDWPA